MTVWNYLKKDGWPIKRKDLKDCLIDPQEQWNNVTVAQLTLLADRLNITPNDLLGWWRNG